jgi:hypothetical protein
LNETLLVRPDGNLVRFLLIVVVVLGRLNILLDFFLLLPLLMMCILVGLLLIIVLIVISKPLGGEYVNILIGHARGMKEVDEGFLVLIQPLREVVQCVG